MSTVDRAFWLKLTLIVAFSSGFLLSSKLWVASRFFPTAPLSEFLPPIPASLDYIWFGTLWVCLFAMAIAPKPQLFIWTFILLVGGLSAWDQNRWQPWCYQYLFMIGALNCYPWGRVDATRQEAVLNVCRLVVASIYFWSGVQKMNVIFFEETFPWMLDPLTENIAPPMREIVHSAGYAVPFIESAIGLALLTQIFRAMAIGLAIAMHVFILLCMGPLGQNWNTIVWPWNLAMILFVLILFVQTRELSLRAILFARNFLWHKVALLLFGVMPFFSFFNLWDSYLSSALYSGNITKAYLFVEENIREKLPPEVQKFAQKTGSRMGYKLDIVHWANQEIGVLPYPEARIYRQIARQICGYAEKASDVMLIIQSKPNWLSGASTTSSYDCERMGNERNDRQSASELLYASIQA
jgi:hypothetical protein